VLRASLRYRLADFELDLTLDAAPGSTLALVGESGSGKTTALRLLAGLARPDQGRIEVGDALWCDTALGIWIPAHERTVGFVAQDYALFPHLTVQENIGFGLQAVGIRRGVLQRRVADLLERFDLSALADRRPAQLSGGQQQRAALARALALDPALLLLDEPLSALDVRTRHEVRSELRAVLAGLPCITVLVTHSPVEALVLGDRIAVLEDGRVSQVGNREELLRRPRSAYIAEFMGLNLMQGRVLSSSPEDGTRVTTGDGELLVAGPVPDTTAPLVVVVSPREITLYRSPPAASAQNLYHGRVLEMVPEPPFGERVRVVLDTHPRLVAEVTAAAVAQLGLTEGAPVYASFKATGAVAYH